MSEPLRGTIINLHAYGAVARIEDGRLAGVPLAEVEKHRPAFERSLQMQRELQFIVTAHPRRPVAVLAPLVRDEHLDEQIAQYLKMTEEWEKPDVPPAHERHFLRKKRRAALFESKHSNPASSS